MGFDGNYKKLAKRAKRQARREKAEMEARAKQLEKAEFAKAKQLAEYEATQRKLADEERDGDVKINLGSNPLFKANRRSNRRRRQKV